MPFNNSVFGLVALLTLTTVAFAGGGRTVSEFVQHVAKETGRSEKEVKESVLEALKLDKEARVNDIEMAKLKRGRDKELDLDRQEFLVSRLELSQVFKTRTGYDAVAKSALAKQSGQDFAAAMKKKQDHEQSVTIEPPDAVAGELGMQFLAREIKKASVESALPSERLLAIEKIARTVFVKDANKHFKKYEFGDGVDHVVKGLVKIIEESRVLEVRKAAARALGEFLWNNVITAKVVDFPGRIVHDWMRNVEENYEIPDDVRQVLYGDLKNIAAELKSPEVRPYVPSRELRKKHVISFLGKTPRELNARERAASRAVDEYLKEESEQVKREAYEFWLANDRVLDRFEARVVLATELKNGNFLSGLIYGLGAKLEGANQANRVITTRRGGLIRYTVLTSGEFRDFSEVEKRRIREAFLGPYEVDLGTITE